VIIYDLRCEQGHKFEGWFQNRLAFEKQREDKLISCPVCGSTETEIVPSSLTVVGKEDRGEKKKEIEITPMQALKMLYDYVEKNFQDVGDKFAEVAIRMHYGEEEERNIRGTTTKEEEEELRAEGVVFFKIPVPKFDS